MGATSSVNKILKDFDKAKQQFIEYNDSEILLKWFSVVAETLEEAREKYTDEELNLILRKNHELGELLKEKRLEIKNTISEIIEHSKNIKKYAKTSHNSLGRKT